MHRARIAITQLLLLGDVGGRVLGGGGGEVGRAHGTRLFSSSGLSALENVLTPRQHMLAQQYRGRAAVLQRLGRLQIKHTITCMEPRGDSASEGCDGARRPPGYPLFVYTAACFIECRGNETSQSSRLTGGGSGGGGGHKYVACNCETPPQREREKDTGHLWTIALETSMFTVDTTDPVGPSIR